VVIVIGEQGCGKPTLNLQLVCEQGSGCLPLPASSLADQARGDAFLSACSSHQELHLAGVVIPKGRRMLPWDESSNRDSRSGTPERQRRFRTGPNNSRSWLKSRFSEGRLTCPRPHNELGRNQTWMLQSVETPEMEAWTFLGGYVHAQDGPVAFWHLRRGGRVNREGGRQVFARSPFHDLQPGGGGAAVLLSHRAQSGRPPVRARAA
jgi:hypothetical protein